MFINWAAGKLGLPFLFLQIGLEYYILIMAAKPSSKKLQLFNEDCVAGMKKRLKARSIDVVVTSPPYNLGIKYKSYNDKVPRSDYLAWLRQWGEAVKRVLKDSGSLFLNIGSKPSDPLVPFQVLETMQKDDLFILQNVIHWVKSIYIDEDPYSGRKDINVGHYKPINSRRFLNDAHEYIFHFTKKGDIKLNRQAVGVPYKDASNISRWKSAGANIRCRGNCWFIRYRTIQNRTKDRPHPASFPSELAVNCIKLHGVKRGMRILDPFMGLGNTGLACQKLNAAFIGFEIDPYYFRRARQTLSAGGK